MQEGQNARQQVVERIRQSTSILVAVGNNPSVDALAAALGLSLMLNKMNKHATAVFSGQIPPAIRFLEPAKTFESNVDALRDFIISLDKEKADRLRYKVEDDVVRIFITPYKTSITEKDLQYSQGDFNVDLILALGVEKRDELDKAIVSHGRILHDATVVTINMNNQHSSLGALDWNDGAASSLCEMLVGLSEALQQPGILDAQISTALLTGVVAATDRFSNKQTTPRVMTMAAQLMAAGANQQLIAINLEQAHAIAAKPQAGPMAKQEPSIAPAPMQEEKPKEAGELDITHEPTPEPQPKPVAARAAVPESKAEAELEAALPGPQVSHALLPELQKDLEDAVRKAEGGEPEPKAPGGHSVNDGAVEEPKIEKEEDYLSSHGTWKGKRLEPPTLGGTLNATTEEAREDNEKAEEDDRNKTLLNHPGEQGAQQGNQGSRKKQRHDRDRRESKPAEQSAPTIGIAPSEPPVAQLTANEPVTTPAEPVAPELPPAPQPVADNPPLEPQVSPAPEAAPESDLDLAALHSEATAAAQAAASSEPAPAVPAPTAEVDSARLAVTDALDNQPFNPANQPLDAVGAQPMPAMPDMPVSEPLTPEALQALPPAPNSAPVPSPSDLPPLPPMPPMPSSDMALPPAPTTPLLPAPASTIDVPPAPDLPGLNAPAPPITPPSAGGDPAQFKIPGA
ncbi:MAG TPA: hypothetical protein VM581_01705 [Magnetospirillaceae bacterium]|nr:hypothetical protein [Magnetospirillaceae bacterium]